MHEVALRELQKFVGKETQGKGFLTATFGLGSVYVSLKEVIVDNKVLCPAISYEGYAHDNIETCAAVVLIELKKWQYESKTRV